MSLNKDYRYFPQADVPNRGNYNKSFGKEQLYQAYLPKSANVDLENAAAGSKIPSKGRYEFNPATGQYTWIPYVTNAGIGTGTTTTTDTTNKGGSGSRSTGIADLTGGASSSADANGNVSTGIGGFTLGPDGVATPNTVTGIGAALIGAIPLIGPMIVNKINDNATTEAKKFNISVNDTNPNYNGTVTNGDTATAGPEGTGGQAAQASKQAAAAMAATGADAATIGAVAQAAADGVLSGKTVAQAVTDAVNAFSDTSTGVEGLTPSDRNMDAAKTAVTTDPAANPMALDPAQQQQQAAAALLGGESESNTNPFGDTGDTGDTGTSSDGGGTTGAMSGGFGDGTGTSSDGGGTTGAMSGGFGDGTGTSSDGGGTTGAMSGGFGDGTGTSGDGGTAGGTAGGDGGGAGGGDGGGAGGGDGGGGGGGGGDGGGGPGGGGGGARGGLNHHGHFQYHMARGGLSALAAGGLGSLGDYSDGGRLLRGPGDGVSDSIPAVIGHKRPARLADGEFVVPARIVSELGNGSTQAGARKLYAMLERIQAGRKKSMGKGKVATNSRADKHLPA